MEQDTPNVLSIYHGRITTYIEEENWKEALHLADTAISRAKQAYDIEPELNLPDLALFTEIKGDILRQTGECEEARQYYDEALQTLSERPDLIEETGRVHASQAVVYDTLDQPTEAIENYEKSIAFFEKLSPPAVYDIADLSNNLAFLYRDEGDTDKAESLFIRALEICHKEFGIEHEETALICNNLGALYSASEHHEQAREMQKMALDGRLAALGRDHIDTAQSHANLAAAEANIDNHEEAKVNFEKAIDIYERHLEKAAHDYVTVTANYTEYLKALGEEKTATAIEKRSSKHLKKL